MTTPRVPILGLAALLAACSGPASDGLDPDDDTTLDPQGDEDGDGFTNADEEACGSDPLDASDVPYAGGWPKGDCRDDIEPTGDAEGQIAADFALPDQFGEMVHLHDFCDKTVMLEFSGFT